MSDLFHEHLPLEFIQQVFQVMNECSHHTFQVLTKRPHIAAAHASRLLWTDNIWLGTSVEDKRVIHRVRTLQQIPAKVRFLSVEPLLGPLARLPLTGIHWVIVGGESGPHARGMEPDWVRAIRDRCVARDVPFFFKQWGGTNKKATGRLLDGRAWNQMPNRGDNGRHTSDDLARRTAHPRQARNSQDVLGGLGRYSRTLALDSGQ
jgi:protein gp37